MKTTPAREPDTAFFSMDELVAERARSSRAYLEFLRVPMMSAGLYVLPAGAVDGQKPHTEDEVYVVMEGRGRFVAAGEDRAVRAGDVIYVRRGVAHRFHTIEQELRVLVLFAPAEYSGAG